MCHGVDVMRDKIVTCIQCDNTFILTAEEQKKLLDRGFSLPKRCPECRRKKAKIHELDERRKTKGKKRESHKRNSFDDEENEEW